MIDIEERKQAEQEFHKLLDVFPQYMCVYKSDGRPLYANDGLLESFGFTLSDFRADDFQTRAFHPDDVERVRTTRQEAMRAGEGWEVEARILRRDGQYRWFLIRGRPFRDEKGNIVRWFSSGTDIEDRKQAQRELQQLVDAVPQHIVVLYGNGRRLYANQAVLDYHGLTPEEFLVVDHSQCFHPDDLEAYDRHRQSGIASGEPWEAEVRLHRKDGQYRWFLIRGRPLRDERGLVIRWYLARTDIEDRKQAERELQQLVDAVPQHMIVLAADGQSLYANKVALDFYGFTLEQCLDQNSIKKKIHPDDLASYLDNRQRGIPSGAPFSAEVRLRSRDEQYRWFLILFNPLRDGQGHVVRWYATATDIEDRKQAEEALRQARLI